jgi:predicted Fe-Mo cluster-binding NifX family protein
LNSTENFHNGIGLSGKGTIVARCLLLKEVTTLSLLHDAMSDYHCIFCSKSYHRLLQSAPLHGAHGVKSPPGIPCTAVPVFNGRVSPVLDSCTQFYMLKPIEKKETAVRILPVKGGSIFERISEIKKLGIQVIICGAVSESFYNLLRESDIEVVCGITGDIDEVVAAYRAGSLSDARFRMPGFD